MLVVSNTNVSPSAPRAMETGPAVASLSELPPVAGPKLVDDRLHAGRDRGLELGGRQRGALALDRHGARMIAALDERQLVLGEDVGDL